MGICRGWRSPLFFSVLLLVLFLPLILSVSNCIVVIRSHKFRREVDPINQIPSLSGLPLGRDCPTASNAKASVLSIRSMLVHNRTFKLGMTFRLQQFIQSTTTPLDRILLGYVMVTVANSSYSKVERSIGILNVFVDFIQNSAGVNTKKQHNCID